LADLEAVVLRILSFELRYQEQLSIRDHQDFGLYSFRKYSASASFQHRHDFDVTVVHLLVNMAILKEGKDQYEVRIKRCPDETYFDEYIDFENREKPDATRCKRYIIGEEGKRFIVQATLHKGFDFGEYKKVQLQLWLPGMSYPVSSVDIKRPGYTTKLSVSMSRKLEYTNDVIAIGGQLETRFVFRSLEVGKYLVMQSRKYSL
jgi:hypothetical protein